ncbi:effector-associated domain 2-containing protein [Streptomyces sp. cg28]|uniref:effector-associated domain 2-containing protein n=1 Tax=Streptomyces sp. cg28 TaxID=3403457 RepID=UPI003B211A91
MTHPDIDPRRVTALVVGIEEYAAGDDWRLPGPAHDAVRFRDWLRGRGVPEDNILLHLAPAPGQLPDVPHRPADQATLHHTFVEELPWSRGEFLWVWWGGHGVLDQEERIRLYCADATAQGRRNLDLESACRLLASDAVSGFGRQMWVVDACQTFDERHRFPLSPSTERLGAGGRTTVHEQALLLAASRGQRAANDPVLRSGLFSGLVLDELGRPGVGVAPDPERLFAAVQARVEKEVWAAGRSDQLPTLILRRPGHERTLGPPDGPRAGATGSLSALNRVVEALLAYPSTHGPDERQTLILMLDPRLTARMRRNPAPRPDLVAVVTALRGRADALWTLYTAVTSFDDDPARADELRAAIEEFLAGG